MNNKWHKMAIEMAQNLFEKRPQKEEQEHKSGI